MKKIRNTIILCTLLAVSLSSGCTVLKKNDNPLERSDYYDFMTAELGDSSKPKEEEPFTERLRDKILEKIFE